MHAMPVMIVVLCLMAIAYRFYSAFLAAQVAVLGGEDVAYPAGSVLVFQQPPTTYQLIGRGPNAGNWIPGGAELRWSSGSMVIHEPFELRNPEYALNTEAVTDARGKIVPGMSQA